MFHSFVGLAFTVSGLFVLLAMMNIVDRKPISQTLALLVIPGVVIAARLLIGTMTPASAVATHVNLGMLIAVAMMLMVQNLSEMRAKRRAA